MAGPEDLKAAGSAGAEGSPSRSALVVHNASKLGALVHPNKGMPLGVEGVAFEDSSLLNRSLLTAPQFLLQISQLCDQLYQFCSGLPTEWSHQIGALS